MMKVHSPFTSLPLILLFALMVTALAEAGEFYVAPSGNDNNPGTLATPFRTIQKAASVAQPGDTVYIRAGTYRETVRPAYSGTAGNPITFTNYQGELAIISGLDPFTGTWTQHSGEIYRASLSMPLGSENQVFVNGLSMWGARWPNITSYDLDGLRPGMAIVDSSPATNIVQDNALSGAGGNLTGASIYIRSGEFSNGNGAWFAQSGPVTAHASATNQLTVSVPSGGFGMTIAKNNWYYLFGKLELLDAEKEWFYDSADSTLYLDAPGAGAPSNVEVRKRLWSFNLDGRSHTVIRGLTTIGCGITMRASNNNLIDGIHATWVQHSSTAYLGFNESRQNGIVIEGNHNEVRNSTIRYSTHTGIDLSGTSNRAVNNLIEEVCLSAANYANAIGLVASTNGLVSHNTIRGSGRVMIDNGGSLGGSGNLIQYNDFSRFMMLSSDGGAIYGWAREGRGEEIAYNRFSDCGTGGYIRAAFYIDNFGRDIIAHHNVFFNIQGEAIRLNTPSSYNILYNNTTYNVTSSVTRGGENPYSADWADDRIFNNIFSANVNWGTNHFSGHNLASTTNAQLTDPANGNFIPASGSPAVDAGAMIPGITDGYSGGAPDIGAFERGVPTWTAGHDFNNPPNPVYQLTTTPWQNKVNLGGFATLDPWTSIGSTTVGLINASFDSGPKKRGLYKLLRLSGAGGVGVSQVISGLSPNTSYRLTAWVYVEGGETGRMSVSGFGGSTVNLDSTNTTFARKTLTFTTGATNTTATVSFLKQTSNAGAVYFDDAGVAPTVLEAPPAGANLSPTDISLSSSSVVENSPSDTVVGTLTTTDPNSGDTHTYSLVSGETAAFSIVGNQLRTAAVLDFETKASYTVTIRTTDQGGLTFEKAFTISVTDVNEGGATTPFTRRLEAETYAAASGDISAEPSEPHLISLQGKWARYDNVDLTDVTSLTANVAVGTTGTLTFRIGSSTGTVIASVSTSGTSSEWRTFKNYNATITGTHGVVTLFVVGAGDHGGIIDYIDFSGAGSNNDPAPTDILLTSTVIAEGQPSGSVVGYLNAADASEFNTHTYELVAGDVAAFSIDGNRLLANLSFVHASKSSYSVTVRATNALGQSVQKFFTVQVALAGPATDYYVAAIGSDSNPGTLAQPFRTIQKAASLAQPGSTVYVRAGTYRETVVPANTGIAGRPITFRPYLDEVVILSGADPVTGAWTQHSGNIYRKQLEAPALPRGRNQVLVNGENAPIARFPNSADIMFPEQRNGNLTIINPDNEIRLTSTANLSGPLNRYLGATLNIKLAAGIRTTAQVTADPGTGTLTLDPDMHMPSYAAGNNLGFFLQDNLALLDAPGEWFLDRQTNELYLWMPDGTDPASGLVEIKRRTYAFDLTGRSHIVIQGFELFATSISTNTDFDMGDPGSWSFATSNITIDGIRAKYLSYFDISEQNIPGQDIWIPSAFQHGIFLHGYNHRVSNSVLNKSWGSFIVCLGFDNVITNNWIHDGNYLGIGMQSAISMGRGPASPDGAGRESASVRYPYTGGRNEVSFNTIHQVGRDAIGFNGNRNGRIVHNHIYNAMLNTDDGGALYAWREDMEALEIAYNYIHDNGVNRTWDSGIYLDGSFNVRVHHNLIHDAGWGIQTNMKWGGSRWIYNNTVHGDPESLYYYHNPSDGVQFDDTHVINNIFLSPVHGPTHTAYAANATRYSNNIFSTQDPKLADRANGDYRLAADSPAIDGGLAVTPHTDGFTGSAPDIGAFEYGKTPWAYGHTFTTGGTNNAPTNITLSGGSVAENSAIGTVVGSLTTTDPDSGNTHTYSLVSGDTAAFSISSNQLRTAAVLDFETKPSYSVTIRTTDQDGLTFDKAITITVTDVNEVVPGALTATLNEALTTGVTVVDFTAESTNGGWLTFNDSNNPNLAAVQVHKLNPTTPITYFERQGSDFSFSFPVQSNGGWINFGDEDSVVRTFSDGSGPSTATYDSAPGNSTEGVPQLNTYKSGVSNTDEWYGYNIDVSSLPAGTTYTAKFYYTERNHRPNFRGSLLDGSGSVIGSEVGTISATASTAIRTGVFTVTGTLVDGATTFRIEAEHVNNGGASHYFRLGGVTFSTVAPPATAPTTYAAAVATLEWGSIPNNQRGPNDNPRGDRYNNFLKWALGGSMTEPEQEDLAPLVIEEIAPGQMQLHLSYTKAVEALTYRLLWSTDLIEWFDTGVSVEQFDPNSGMHFKTYDVPFGTPKIFGRLEVSEP